MIVMGRPGMGKSSHIYSMLTAPHMFAGVFERVYIIMPETSLESFGEESKFSEIDDTQKYNELSLSNIDEIEQKVDLNKEKGWKSLLILDDVQQDLKGPARNKLLHLAANRRHKRLSIILAAQTYKRIPKQVRAIASDLFCFNLSKENMKAIFEELIEINRDEWERILSVYKIYREDRPKAFLYINLVRQKAFIEWENEVSDETPNTEVVVGLKRRKLN